jgi:hypothetical protein
MTYNSSGTTFMSPRLKQACIAFVTAALSVIVLSLSELPSHAQQGPFAGLTGSWSGSGIITLASGSRERIQCRATYDARSSGNDLQLALRCASDSYNFDLHGRANNSNGNITGTWDEATQHAAGQITGRATGNNIQARAEGQTFSALLGMATHGGRQTISIQSPGSQFSDVTINLNRK